MTQKDFIKFNLPEEIANLDLPDPLLLAYYKNMVDRTIWLDKGIDDTLFEEIRMIYQWNKEDEKNEIPIEDRIPIKILIHSYGGDIDSTFALIDIMKISKTPICTVNVSCCLSAGAIILLNGHKGHRYCMPLSQALIHNGSGGNSGTYEAVIAQTENYKKIIEMLHNNIKEHTLVDQKTLKKWDGKENFLYADDQLKYGLVDYIVSDFSEII